MYFSQEWLSMRIYLDDKKDTKDISINVDIVPKVIKVSEETPIIRTDNFFFFLLKTNYINYMKIYCPGPKNKIF